MKNLSRRKVLLGSLTAAVAAVSAGAIILPASAESNGGVKIMPLGDSITEGTQVPGGYRIGLWQRLAAGGYRNDFVGSGFNGPGQLGDHDHEGHPGWRIDQIDANINRWLSTYQPRTVLLHIGTNDILQNYNVSSAPNRLASLIDKITAAVPNADVFVATIIPISNSGQNNNARTFNNAIPGIVNARRSAGKRVHLVDMNSALSTSDLIDGVHPTANGYDKMAARWFSALLAVPGSIGNGNGTTTPTGSTNLITNGGFESGTSGWAPFGAGTLSATTPARSGSRALLHSGRTGSWNGPGQSLTSKLTNGRSYRTSLYVRTQSGSATFKATLAVTANGTTSYIRLTPDATASSGGWTQLTGTATVSWSGSLTSATLYVESTSGTGSFLIDDVSVQ